MKTAPPRVIVLDDDPSMLASLGRLLAAHGHPHRLHRSPQEMFAAGVPAGPACLLLDQQLDGGGTGVEVHGELIRRGWDLPVIFLTAHWDVRLIVETMRAGADGFLTKPYDPAELLREVDRALAHASQRFEHARERDGLLERAASLTRREREVVAMVAGGLLNKEIGIRLGLAEVTVKLHRGRAMRKLGAGNPAELARIAAFAGIEPSG